MAEWVAAALYVGAGRQADEAEFSLWANALATVDDQWAEEVVTEILQSVDLGQRTPTPALFLEHRRAWVKHRAPKEPTYACPCLEAGMVPVEGQDDAWRPCRRCNPGGYERWAAGKAAPRFAGDPPAGSPTRVTDLRDALAASTSKLEGIE